MKTVITKAKSVFKPVSITVTFETQEEVDTWLAMRGSVNWISHPVYHKFFTDMFPTSTYYDLKGLT
jgi:hypothetical protein